MSVDSAREDARNKATGRFGEQPRAEAAVSLDDDTDLVASRRRLAARAALASTFDNVRHVSFDGDWPESRTEIETKVAGLLADRIRVRAGRPGAVTLLEFGQEGGFSEYSVEWDYDFQVLVDGELVFQSQDYSGSLSSQDGTPTPGRYGNGLTKLLAWLDGGA